MKYFLQHSSWFLLLVFGFAALAALSLLYVYQTGWSKMLTDGISSAVIFTACIGGGISALKSYPTRAGILVYSLLCALVVGVGAWYLARVGLRWWFAADAAWLTWLKTSDPARLVLMLLGSMYVMVFTAMAHQVVQLEDQFKTHTDAALLHRQAELFNLRQQLQPHFLYNSLNSISALMLIDSEKSQQMIGKLSDFLRDAIRREDRDLIPLDEELQYVNDYLSIEMVRFGDRLFIEQQKEVKSKALIPPFLLQPVLENAIKFGLYGRTGKVQIQLHIFEKNDHLIFSIQNPTDASSRPPSGTGFGLKGIYRRLFLLYGRTDLLQTKKDKDSFTTILKIPLQCTKQ